MNPPPPPDLPFVSSRLLKEEFVSNLSGSSMLEIFALSTIIPALILIRQWNSSPDTRIRNDSRAVKKDWRFFLSKLTFDYLFVILPIILAFTVLANWTYYSAVVLILVLLLHILARRGSYSSEFARSAARVASIRRMISSYRVSVMVVTCLSILAVDFRVFPRRFAKTETYGTSVMDLGVGSFVLANSLVSRQARNMKSKSLGASLLSVSPVLLLGFARVMLTKGVDYQVHVGEYGVHWNFFFTLAAVALLTSIFDIHPRYCGLLGSTILLGYQICLLHGLNGYLTSSQRSKNLLSQNKEGIFSLFGYWGLYLIGVNIGYHLFFRDARTADSQNFGALRLKVWVLSIVCWFVTIILDKYVEKVSRRMCNLGYTTIVLAQNFQVLGILMLSDLVPDSELLVIEEAFDQNLLAAFLVANLLTGLVNLYTDTLSASLMGSLGILAGYAMTLSLIVGYAKFQNIKLKFW